MKTKYKETVIIFRPFAYLNLFDWQDLEVTIEAKGKIFHAKQLFWRIYWVGML